MNRFVFCTLICVLLVGCKEETTQPTDGVMEISYTSVDGFTPQIRTKLSIDPSGVVSLESVYPILKEQLAPEEHKALLSLVLGIAFLADNYPGGCIDDPYYTIGFRNSGYAKTVRVEGCALWHDSTQPPIQTMRTIINVFEALGARIYQVKAPWIGLQISFSLDRESYGSRDTILIRGHVTNPTLFERSLPFPHSSQIYFQVDKYNFPSFYYAYPLQTFYPWVFGQDTTVPTVVTLRPGEQRDLLYLWDQSVTDTHRKRDTLGIGCYNMHMGLLSGNLPVSIVDFDVFDRSLPVKGDVIPDPMGEWRSSPTYCFQLAIRNCRQSQVTLHFSKRQQVGVQLFDTLNKQGPPLYTSPIDTVNAQSEITILPGQTIVVSNRISKEDLPLPYFWVYAKLRLLCDDFEFVRDAELRIFQ